jgi:hypothetical protein
MKSVWKSLGSKGLAGSPSNWPLRALDRRRARNSLGRSAGCSSKSRCCEWSAWDHYWNRDACNVVCEERGGPWRDTRDDRSAGWQRGWTRTIASTLASAADLGERTEAPTIIESTRSNRWSRNTALSPLFFTLAVVVRVFLHLMSVSNISPCCSSNSLLFQCTCVLCSLL